MRLSRRAVVSGCKLPAYISGQRTSGTEEQNFGFTDCNSPEGFKRGNFSSVIELFG